jgi:hypothetical protein
VAREPDASTGVVNLKYMVADLDTASAPKPGAKLLEGWNYHASEALLDGPVSRRVAIIDIDPATGTVLPGARFQPPGKKRKTGSYRIADPADHTAVDFQQVSVFGAVLKTMNMFEETDVLGRPLRWAFDGEQLLVVPRAGRMANAFYHRNSRSLQFFFFDAVLNDKQATVYTCLSPDIIAHETTHAILDGIAPDLYDAMSPQSLAVHEGMADLAAVIFALRTAELRNRVLLLSGGDLAKAEAFNEIAKQFGTALAGGEDEPLRDLYNEASLTSGWGKPVGARNPHALSTVLTGALYRLLVADHERAKKKIVDAIQPPPTDRKAALFSAAGKALFQSGEKFKRMVFRALDYLPPGEISFADYGRALVAADFASNPEPSWERDFVKEEFVRRGIVAAASELDPVRPEIELPADLDLALLVRSDWLAYQFAEARRNALKIPAGVPFEVRPRLDVTKTTYRSQRGLASARECIFKIAWQETQLVGSLGGLANELSVTYGTTLAIDWDTKAVRVLLSTSRRHPSQGAAATAHNEAMRASYVKQCIDEGLFELDGPSMEVQGNTLKVRGLGQLLHMAGR